MGSFHILHPITLHLPFLSDWFHGDIYSVTIENVNNLIGFKCHRCRLRSLPVCPYAETVTILNGQSDKDHGIKFVDHSVDEFVEDEDPNCPKDLGAPGSLQELHDHDIEQRLNGHTTEIEFDYNNSLEELNDHDSLKEFDAHSTDKDPEDDKSLKKVEAHNELKIDDPGFEKEPGRHYCPKDLNSDINLKDLDDCRTDKEIKNNNCLSELNGDNNCKALDSYNSRRLLNSHDSQEELDCSSKFSPKEVQCPMELDGFSSLKLVSHNILEELDNHNCLKESGSKNGSKELDNNGSLKDSGDFLAEHLNNIRISGEETPVITPETDSVNKSLGLQSKDDSGKSVPTEHEIDLQVVVSL